jgi:hypothetical protein
MAAQTRARKAVLAMASKRKAEASATRDELTTAFIAELQRDFAEHGREIIESVRKEAPSKYAELVLRLIPLPAPATQAQNPAPKTSREIAQRLLADIQYDSPSDDDLNAALILYDDLVAGLERIRDRHLS